MSNYFRITAYHPKENISIIMDSYGLFTKLWQFSSDLVNKGFNIIAVGNEEKFLDGNFEKTEYDDKHYLLRANMHAKPIETTYEIDGVVYKALQVEDRIYVPDKTALA